MIGVIKRLVAGEGSAREPTVLYECRHCGATLDSETDTCPYCGPSETARFEF